MAYLDPVGFKSKSIVNLCWTVTLILHELSWYVAHPILHNTTRYFSQLANGGWSGMGGWSISWHRRRRAILNMFNIARWPPDEAPTADSVSGDHSHWPSRQHRGTIGASDRLMWSGHYTWSVFENVNLSGMAFTLESSDTSFLSAPGSYSWCCRHNAKKQATGETPVASWRNGSSQKLNQVQLLRQHALRHGTRHALRHGNPRSQAGRYHVCFPLVALDLRQKSINRPSLSHVATTCRVSHIASH